MDLSTLIPQAKIRQPCDLTRPNTPVEVWGRIKLTKTPKSPKKQRVEQIEFRPFWACAHKVRKKPGPKSMRPFWESVLGRPIPDVVWASAMKATQYGRGAKPITADDLRRRIVAIEETRP